MMAFNKIFCLDDIMEKGGGGERESCVKSAKRSVRLGLLRRAGCRSVDQLVYPVSANAQLAESRYK